MSIDPPAHHPSAKRAEKSRRGQEQSLDKCRLSLGQRLVLDAKVKLENAGEEGTTWES
jgi:hypothetical protein